MDLNILRKKIDDIDDSIIRLLAKRLEMVKKVGIYKKQHNIPPLDSTRWQQVLRSKIELGKSLSLPQKLIEIIYNAIHDAALEIEKHV